MAQKPALEFSHIDEYIGPPRCLRCGYRLEGLSDPKCPECGLAFKPNDPNSYDRRPPFLFWRYWMPAVPLALAVGLVSLFGAVAIGSSGYALILGTPIAIGAILGYGFQFKRVAQISLCLGVLVVLGFALYMSSLAGAFCALLLTAAMFVPVAFGAMVGWALRRTLKGSQFSQRWYLPLIGLLVFLVGWHWMEQRWLFGPMAVESVATELAIPAPPAVVWDAIQFYEQVQGEPPWLCRIGLPRPLYAKGSMAKVGDVKTCVYSKGRIVKQITAVEPGRRLAFRVIEQTNIENRSVRLVGGSFEFEALGDNMTRVRLVTTYEPLLQARLAWRPLEEQTVHQLHEHVLEGMAHDVMEQIE